MTTASTPRRAEIVFYLRFLSAELRRRRGRTVLTALGLGIGVGLVVVVSALSAGLDAAQQKVLEPLTGVGTDMRVSRPLGLPSGGSRDGTGGFASLADEERRLLLKENPKQGLHFEPEELGEPGERFTEHRTVSSELSFPAAEVRDVAALEGAEDAAAALSLQAVTIEGEVPEPGVPVNVHGGGYDITSVSVTGVDVRKPNLAPVTPAQVIEGRYFSRSLRDARSEALVDIGYARKNAIRVGERTTVAGKRLKVVGLSAAPLGGAAANVYLELGRLQRLTEREGRANVMQVRAKSVASVETLSGRIRKRLRGAEVTTASELAERVTGSLVDARNLSSKLGTALAVVALGAAFLIAILLALVSVQKRIRELGTLKALGWNQRLVVRQVSAESVVQGLLGGMIGAALGIAGAALIDTLDLKLRATATQAQAGGFAAFGQGDVTTDSTQVLLGAPLDVSLLALAVALATLGGLLAGGAGALRAARLRPAEALRSAE